MADALLADAEQRQPSAPPGADIATRLDDRALHHHEAGRYPEARALDPAAVAGLAAKYHAGVGDWESGAIAWVASHNHTPVLILRGVSDVVDAAGNDPTYNDLNAWQRASIAVMTSLVALLGDALPDLLPSPR